MTDSANVDPVAQAGGIKKKNLAIIALGFAVLWFLALSTESWIVIGIAGVLTLLAAGFAIWAWRLLRRHRALAGVLQGAADSPEARKAALAKLDAEAAKKKKGGDLTHLLAKAQLLASDEPVEALKVLDPLDLKSVPPNMQDDFALLKSQLLLGFGRAKEARPLVDSINLDNPQRKEHRPVMAAVVAETWARTGSAKEATELLDSVVQEGQKSDAAPQLQIARVFACYGAGKKGHTRTALQDLAEMDFNFLGRFVSPQARVHPGLARLAREVLQKHQPRQMQRPARARR